MNCDKRCGTCRFWGGHEPDEEHQHSKFQPCLRIEHDESCHATAVGRVYEIGADDRPEDMADALECEASIKDPAVVQDGSGYYAALKTREDFGCVLWEEKA